MLPLVILLPLLAGTLLTGWSGSRPAAQQSSLTAWLAGAVTAASFTLLLMQLPAVMAGEVLQSFIAWVPEIGLNLGLRLDGLSLMFALLITGIGLLIILYAHFYLGVDDPVGKFYSTLMLFMAAMLGIVLSDNLLLLVVFWELTSISSFLLVGFWKHRADARAGA
ncbi:MAG: proton-conducting transporter membrane subunit, partial [Hydrogenophaga sp.]|nr:proton-conducting transporter membrane subunit [Hydrogenophaga sp.]